MLLLPCPSQYGGTAVLPATSSAHSRAIALFEDTLTHVPGEIVTLLDVVSALVANLLDDIWDERDNSSHGFVLLDNLHQNGASRLNMLPTRVEQVWACTARVVGMVLQPCTWLS